MSSFIYQVIQHQKPSLRGRWANMLAHILGVIVLQRAPKNMAWCVETGHTWAQNEKLHFSDFWICVQGRVVGKVQFGSKLQERKRNEWLVTLCIKCGERLFRLLKAGIIQSVCRICELRKLPETIESVFWAPVFHICNMLKATFTFALLCLAISFSLYPLPCVHMPASLLNLFVIAAQTEYFYN